MSEDRPSIAYASPYVPAEWIAAHGFRPARVTPEDTRGPGATGACPFSEAFVAATGNGHRASVFTTTCDQMRRASEEPAGDTFLLNMPHTESAASLGLYVDELRRLGRFLERLGGTSPAIEEIRRTMRAFDEARRRLLDARGRLSGRAWADAVVEFLSAGDPGFTAPEGPRPGRGVPIALVGVPLWGAHRELYRLVEEAGGEVVLDGTKTGERGLPAPYDRRSSGDDPLLEIAAAHHGSMVDAFRRPNHRLYQWLDHGLRRREVRGIVFLRCAWCDLWHGELGRLTDWSPVPVVDVDLSGDRGGLARMETRVQALLDVIR